MRPGALGWLAVAAMAIAPADAAAAPVPVNIEFQAFAPAQLDVLPGDSVEWTNTSERRHTVTANDGSFDSGDLFGGNRFAWQFDSVGSYAYHCTVHLVMTGEVDVRRVLLDPLPAAPVPAGQRIPFTGRTADPSEPVRIESQTGSGFRTIATATPTADGAWSAPVTAHATADYRAAVGSDASQVRRLLVTDRRIRVRATRHGVHVTVTPPDPNAQVILQLHLRERFGWWPAARARLDYLSRADFRVRGPVQARVALVDLDGWTPLTVSPVIRVGERGRR
jgi:plastocyanin